MSVTAMFRQQPNSFWVDDDDKNQFPPSCLWIASRRVDLLSS